MIVSPYHDKKAVFDRLLGIVLLIISAPLIAILIAIVRLTSTGAGIYKQTRVGLNGSQFHIYKIRTMYSDAEACGTPRWATQKDPRITPAGQVLRLLHLDELPQLLNIVRGEMSLIGPRPERPEFVTELSKCIPNYNDRLAVLPGVTGLAQINLPPDDSLKSVCKKVMLDIEYIEQANLGLELRIFLCTAARMCGLRHGMARKLFGVSRSVPSVQVINASQSQSSSITVELDDTVVNMPALVAVEVAKIGASSSCSSNEGHMEFYGVEKQLQSAVIESPSHAKISAAPRQPR